MASPSRPASDFGPLSPIWLIGCGNMGKAMLDGWLRAGLDPQLIQVIDPGLPPLPAGLTALADIPDVVVRPRTLVLAVKPQAFDTVAEMIAPAITLHTLVISILAGVETVTLADRLGAAAVIRAMPNTPAAIGKGVTALYARSTSETQRQQAETLTAPLGGIAWIADEGQFDAVTALSGCGPGFTFRFIDAMAEAGVVLGLDAALAARLALATVSGAAALAEGSAESPAVLADRVASPGGATREGLNVLDETQNGLKELMRRTLQAAADRSAEMAAAARREA